MDPGARRVIDLLAFVVAVPLAVELIAAAYGPLDLARYPRLAALAWLRLLVLAGLFAALVAWLGAPFALGACAYGVFFVLKHIANEWLGRRAAGHRRPVWTDERAGDIRGDD